MHPGSWPRVDSGHWNSWPETRDRLFIHLYMFTFIHLLHSLKKYLHTYLVLGIFLVTGDSAMKPTEKNPCPPKEEAREEHSRRRQGGQGGWSWMSKGERIRREGQQEQQVGGHCQNLGFLLRELGAFGGSWGGEGAVEGLQMLWWEQTVARLR